MSNQKKNILLITYYWPPAGGPGVQRWLGFVKHLSEMGFKLHVYSPENPYYPIIDNSLEEKLPKIFKSVKTKIWEPFRLAELFFKQSKEFKKGNLSVSNSGFLDKLLIFIRGNFFIPDARIFWVKPSVKFLKKYIVENQIETIISTGPPHSLHLIGLYLKQNFPNLNWLADFRDPWTDISYHKHLKLTKFAENKHNNLENLVFKNANTVIATSYSDSENFKNKGAKNALTITNGFDLEENSTYKKEKNKKFTFSYIGGLEDLRNPTDLWQLVEAILIENKEFRENFILRFVGTISENIINHIKQNHTFLFKTIEKISYLSHDKAFEEMKKADLLLLCSFYDEQSKGIIPGKIYEYLVSETSIFATGYTNSDIEIIMNKTKSGFYFNALNKMEATNFLVQSFNNWKEGIFQKPINIEEFSRLNLAKQLIKWL